jgi:hypothetical protein
MIPDTELPIPYSQPLQPHESETPHSAFRTPHSPPAPLNTEKPPEQREPSAHEHPPDAKTTPSKVFDNRTRFQYCHLLRQGLTKGAAARLLGVSPRTIQLAAKTDPDLADRIRQARLECHATAAAYVARAGEKSWRAAAWLLDRGRRRHGAGRPRKTPLPLSDPRARDQMKQLVRNVLLEVMPELRKEINAKRTTSSPLAAGATAVVDAFTADRKARLAALGAEVKALRDAGHDPDLHALWRKHLPGVPLNIPPSCSASPDLPRNSAHPNAQSSPAPVSPSASQSDAQQQLATNAPLVAEPAIAQNP